MSTLQGSAIHTAVTSAQAKARSKPRSNNLKILIDEDSGDMAIHSYRYGNDKTIIIPLDEMPDKYQAFFAGFVLTNR